MTFRPDSKKECLLSEDLVALMRENFERLDKHEDLVVPRAALVDSIRKDVRVKKYLNVGVIYLPKVRKEIALRKVLHQIEQEEFIKADQLDAGDSNFVSSKKYISWKNFMDYFINYNQNPNVTDADLEFKKDETDDQSLIEIPKTLKEKMRAIFNELKDEDGFVKSFDFLNKLKSDPTVINMLEAQSRIRAKYGDIPPEKLRETLARIEDTSRTTLTGTSLCSTSPDEAFLSRSKNRACRSRTSSRRSSRLPSTESPSSRKPTSPRALRSSSRSRHLSTKQARLSPARRCPPRTTSSGSTPRTCRRAKGPRASWTTSTRAQRRR